MLTVWNYSEWMSMDVALAARAFVSRVFFLISESLIVICSLVPPVLVLKTMVFQDSSTRNELSIPMRLVMMSCAISMVS